MLISDSTLKANSHACQSGHPPLFKHFSHRSPPPKSLYPSFTKIIEKMGCAVGYVDDILEKLGACDKTEVVKLKVELRILKTLLKHIESLTDNNTLEDPVLDTLAEARIELVSAEYLDDKVGKLEQQITFLRPRIRSACDYVFDHSLQSESLLPVDYDLWEDLSMCLRVNLMDLYYGKGEPTELRSLLQKLDSLGSFVRKASPLSDTVYFQLDYYDLLTHFAVVTFRAAYLSYLCCIDDETEELMAGETGVMLIDLQRNFKPCNLEVTELCLKVLRITKLYFTTDVSVQHFLDFLIPEAEVANFRPGLTCLIAFLVDAPNLYKEDDVKLLLMDITATVIEVGSLTQSYLLAPFELLQRIELLNAEVLLMELLYPRASANTSTILVEDQINSLLVGQIFLETFQGNASQNVIIWADIKALASEAGSIYNSFPDKSSLEYFHAVDKLFDKIKLMKTEVLLKKLLNSHPSLKYQIEILHLEITFLRTFLMGPLEKNGKNILRRVESVASDAGSIYYSLRASNSGEDVVRTFNVLVPQILEKIKLVYAEIKEIYLRSRTSSSSDFPKTHDGVGFINFLLENLRELLEHKGRTIAYARHQIEVVYREMEIFRLTLMEIEKHCDEDSDIKTLGSRIIDLAYEAEYLIDSCAAPDGIFWYHRLWLSDLVEEMKEVTKIKASEISSKEVVLKGTSLQVPQSARKVLLAANDTSKDDEVVVDLDDQMTLMIDKLTRGSRKQEVVSITGMAGLGKTTLANKLYQHPKVTYHFHVRAWCVVSPSYQKRELLLQILDDIKELTDDILEMDDDDLDMELYRSLKRKTYLIVLDDLWNTEAWNDIERSFPDDGNGSRVMITSRLPDVVSKIRAESIPHPLRPLSDVESWILLQKKLFQTKDCPVELMAAGKQIAESCEGLPLAVVAISGLLGKTEMEPDSWKKIAETLSLHATNDQETRCRDILELSYRHLPNYLKPCFLYLGAFMQDKEISVRKLTWLWVAEGFVAANNTELKSAEEVAEEYLKDLIGRSLVITSKRRSDRGVKTCRVHDMLQALCLLKCKEESFCQCISGYEELFAASPEDSDYGVDPNYCYPTNWITYEKYRLSICSKRNHFVMSRPRGPQVHSLLYSASSDLYPTCPYDISFIADNFKLLRILDLECINMGNSFPEAIVSLVHLRYLALCGDIDCIPAWISKLWNLEILVVKGLKGKVVLTEAIWSMAKLRHVHVSSNAVFSLQDSDPEDESKLEKLVSLSFPSLSCGKDTECILRRLPNLRKLKCLFTESQIGDVGKCNQFPVLGSLTGLHSLKVIYSGRIAHPRRFDFPLTLKKLTLSKFRLPWDCVSEIGRLPNLEVLKLLSRAFEGKVWDMKEGEFFKLKFLKLDNLNIARWNASSDNLPNLQRLVLRSCRQLEEVPCGFGDIVTLERIEVQLCRRSAEDSVRRLKEEQLDMGNEDLQVLIDRSDWDF